MSRPEAAPSFKSLKSLFDRIDLDGDKTVSLQEWNSAFDKIDTNRSGAITRKEWCLREGDTCVFDAITKRRSMAAITREEWRRTFSMLDKNKDGAISLQEWAAPALGGRTVRFDMHNWQDVLLLRSIAWKFDDFGAYIMRVKPEPTHRRLFPGDRVININQHFIYGESRAEIEYLFGTAQRGRLVDLMIEDFPSEAEFVEEAEDPPPQAPAAEAFPPQPPPKESVVGSRLRALQDHGKEYRQGDLGRVWFADEEYLFVTWERTGLSMKARHRDSAKFYAPCGQLKAAPEEGDLVQPLPGDPSKFAQADLAVVTSVDDERVELLWKSNGWKKAAPKQFFLKYYTCVGRFAI